MIREVWLSRWPVAISIPFVQLAALLVSAPVAQAETYRFDVLHTFVDRGAGGPESFVVGADGTVYGTTVNGGEDQCGTIVRVLPSGALEVVHEFTVRDRRWFLSLSSCAHVVVLGADGDLYGLTREYFGDGGVNRLSGYVFRFGRDGTFTILKDIEASFTPVLVSGRDGLLYGMLTIQPPPCTYCYTALRDANAVFRMTPGGDMTVLRNFPATDLPSSVLVGDSDGSVYGHAASGAYRISASGAYSVISASISSSRGGVKALIQETGGDLLGTTSAGLFRLTRAGVVTWVSLLPYTPGTVLLQAADGSFYLSRQDCHAGGLEGPPYQPYLDLRHLTPSGVDVTPTALLQIGKVSSLAQAPDGSLVAALAYPRGAVTNPLNCDPQNDPRGAVVQMTSAGAIAQTTLVPAPNEGYGIVPRLGESTQNTYWGQVGVVLAGDGNFYGVTQRGGTGDVGTVYRMTTSGQVTLVHEFVGGPADGAMPTGLILGRDGALYGTTARGGTSNRGVVFRLAPDGSSFGVVFSFDLAALVAGGTASALVQSVDGTLFGTTVGSTGGGSVFKLTPDGTFSTLRTFPAGPSGQPTPFPTSLLLASDGILYGTTGALYWKAFGSQAGAVFRLSQSGDYSVLGTWTNGGAFGLIQGSDGYLYGALSTSVNLYAEVFRLSTTGAYTSLSGPGAFGFAVPVSLVQASDGTLFGTTSDRNNSAPNPGIFRLNRNGQLSLLRSPVDSPGAAMVIGPDGSLYGVGAPSFELPFADPARPSAFRLTRIEFTVTLGVSVAGGPVGQPTALIAGVPTQWIAQTTPSSPTVEYQFWIRSNYSIDGDTGWHMAQNYSPNPVLSWTPALSGQFVVQVWARGVGAASSWDAYAGTSVFTVAASPSSAVTITGFTVSPAVPTTTGQTVTWAATAAGGIGPAQYRFWLLEPGTGWRVLQDWSALNSVTWTPLRGGTYAVQVWARRAGDLSVAYEAWQGVGPFTVANGPLTLTSVDPSRPLPLGIGATVTWTPTVAGGDGSPLEYEFFLYREATATWALVQPYSPTPSWTWTTLYNQQGRYWLQVWARRQGSTQPLEGWASSVPIDVTLQPIAVTLSSSQGNPPNVPANTPIVWRAVATNVTGPVEYQFWRFDARSGNWITAQPYGPSDTYAWTPTLDEAGASAVQVYVRRIISPAQYEAWAGTGAFLVQP